jgi:hypothetical protein
MAFVKRVRIVYTKGIENPDPFNLAAVVKGVLNRNDRQAFEQAYLNDVKSYADLVTLCEKYVELDDTKPVGTEPQYGAHRDVYSDEFVPWRKLLWDTAAYLADKTTAPSAWAIKISGDDAQTYRGPNLYLRSLTVDAVTSPSVECEDGRHGSGKVVKIRCYPGLAMNVALEKATPVKIAAKLLEHGEKALVQLKARAERETEEKDRRLKARRLVNLIEATFGVPRYYEGSGELTLGTDGAALRITPTDDGAVNLTLTMRVTSNGQLEKLRQPIELIKALKQAGDAAKKEAK